MAKGMMTVTMTATMVVAQKLCMYALLDLKAETESALIQDYFTLGAITEDSCQTAKQMATGGEPHHHRDKSSHRVWAAGHS
mmetsp:Transcript_12174/g.22306  ORF Transcript_12174/g.22306 Transcript_12174/m.22306 type:complete len:81 (-) Transcript_12174:58-300(-)|eukprot:CAMPEP_0174358572 /NCGR_PEP_ID=MMETSP0811_2-20130205/43424_1 /TAXON_ID=73025 ORGANISM="Eutreptiella gymnastica-like, Strain CCMP1594" /NCGR_SAMPLE_ID=MMETSP0811_2 /ASSEMBLY_ACC=CAM_ASM_000667 /LENGTH=80 /DNA_ID=CAMNT_0015492463 /DNA_START=361 /DNA_END=603 /DNA_ORIENTATION=-